MIRATAPRRASATGGCVDGGHHPGDERRVGRKRDPRESPRGFPGSGSLCAGRRLCPPRSPRTWRSPAPTAGSPGTRCPALPAAVRTTGISCSRPAPATLCRAGGPGAGRDTPPVGAVPATGSALRLRSYRTGGGARGTSPPRRQRAQDLHIVHRPCGKPDPGTRGADAETSSRQSAGSPAAALARSRDGPPILKSWLATSLLTPHGCIALRRRGRPPPYGCSSCPMWQAMTSDGSSELILIRRGRSWNESATTSMSVAWSARGCWYSRRTTCGSPRWSA